MKVVEIEVHEITPEYHDWIAYPLNHYYGPTQRTVYVVHTDNGLLGLGEGGGAPEPQETLDHYMGSNPFAWVGDETSLALGTAMYDLMGQAVGVPVYQLFGQKQRSWVPVGSWTVSTHPDHMAEAVTHYAAAGYTWLKYHLSPFENVFDQTEAMQQNAPPGFKIHYDFTMHGTDDHMPELLDKLAEYPVAGCFEDALPPGDIEGYRQLRKRSKLPIVLHHFPLAATYEVLMHPADIYMLGHAKIGDAASKAGLFAAAGKPFMLQNVGGAITRSMVVHMMAAFPTATFHCHNDYETWQTDVVKERLDPVNGFVRVPEKPGLGLTLDRDELERLKNLRLPPQDKWIIKTRFKNSTHMYNIADPDHSNFMVRPDGKRLIPMSYASPIETEYWDDDGSEAYRQMFGRIQREGIVIEEK